MTRYANFHILHPLPFANPNRDDTGAPKTTVYGGTTRGRMSSQSMKRAARTHFEATSGADATHRSKFAADHLMAKVDAALASAPLDDTTRAKVAKSVQTHIAKLTGSSDDAKATLVWLAEAELDKLAGTIAAKFTDADTADAELTKADVDAALTDATESLTIAAFGRMFANRSDLQIEAATQVAHAFTTHAQQVDLDYFTAVDDLQPTYDQVDADGNSKGSGAGHLDVSEYHSGIFYRFFAINRDDLAANWTPLHRGDADAADRLHKFLDAMVRELPTGRDATAAHQTAPTHVLVTLSDRPTSYAPAFETSVTATGNGGFAAASVDRLTDYADKMVRVDGHVERFVFDLNEVGSTNLHDVLASVAAWLANDQANTTAAA